MIATAAFSWGFTLWFAALGGASLVGLARAGRTPDGVSYAAHAIMAGVMALMPWGWSAVVPQAIWIAVFGAFALWYLSLAISRPGTRIGPGTGHHATGTLLWYHGAMMGAMVWMSVLVVLAAGAVGGASVMHHELAMAGGPGALDAPDASGLASAGGAAGWQQPLWAAALTWAFVALFAVAAAWFGARLVSRLAAVRAGSGGGRDIPTALPPAVEAAVSLAMAAGMGVAFAAML
ncbi:DUF5134 domain-containing protein [Agromyces protaetiae]|uniref:DUF5134 domain-containing protein n=1 Tax=Agromyces protaetiae TaxID=2509455 RepID=A0A4P6FF42_9MICO|nr:DUF5134 domain-containing protein [Agromyces protaetiae]QAY72357.1 DUF5134 domain-containing protein [Agromyces protaetiae]